MSSSGGYSISVEIAGAIEAGQQFQVLAQKVQQVDQQIQASLGVMNNFGTSIQSLGGRIQSVSSPLQELTSTEQQLSSSTQQLASAVSPRANNFTNLVNSTQIVGAIFQQTVGDSTQLSASLTQIVEYQHALANAGQQPTGMFTQELNFTIQISRNRCCECARAAEVGIARIYSYTSFSI